MTGGQTFPEFWAMLFNRDKEVAKQRLGGSVQSNIPVTAESLNQTYDFTNLLNTINNVYGGTEQGAFNAVVDQFNVAAKNNDYDAISELMGSTVSALRKAYGPDSVTITPNENSKLGFDLKVSDKVRGTGAGRGLLHIVKGGGLLAGSNFDIFELSPLAKLAEQRKKQYADYYKRAGLTDIGTGTFNKTLQQKIEASGNVEDIGEQAGRYLAQAKLLRNLGRDADADALMSTVNSIKERYGDTKDFRSAFDYGYNAGYLESATDKIFSTDKSVLDNITKARNNLNKRYLNDIASKRESKKVARDMAMAKNEKERTKIQEAAAREDAAGFGWEDKY